MSTTSDPCFGPKTSTWQHVPSALWLTFPAWSIVLLLALLSLFRNGAQVPGEPLIFFGVLAPLAGALPIFRMPNKGLVGKAVLFIAYYMVCAVAMFVVGWASLGLFGPLRARKVSAQTSNFSSSPPSIPYRIKS